MKPCIKTISTTPKKCPLYKKDLYFFKVMLNGIFYTILVPEEVGNTDIITAVCTNKNKQSTTCIKQSHTVPKKKSSCPLSKSFVKMGQFQNYSK